MPVPPTLEAGNSMNNETFLEKSNGLPNYGVRTNEHGFVPPSLLGQGFTFPAKLNVIEKESVNLNPDGTVSGTDIVTQTITNDGVNNIAANNAYIPLSDTEGILFKMSKIYLVTIDYSVMTSSYSELIKPTMPFSVTNPTFYTTHTKVSATDWVMFYHTTPTNIAMVRFHYDEAGGQVTVVHSHEVTNVTLDTDGDGQHYICADYDPVQEKWLLGVGSSDAVTQIAFLIVSENGSTFTVHAHNKLTSGYMTRPGVAWKGTDKFVVWQNYRGGNDSTPHLNVMHITSGTSITDPAKRLALSYSNDQYNTNVGYWVGDTIFVLGGFYVQYFNIDPTTDVITNINGTLLPTVNADYVGYKLNHHFTKYDAVNRTLWFYGGYSSYKNITKITFNADFTERTFSYTTMSNIAALTGANWIDHIDSSNNWLVIPIPDNTDFNTNYLFQNLRITGFNGVALNSASHGEDVDVVLRGFVEVLPNCVYITTDTYEDIIIGQWYELINVTASKAFLKKVAYNSDRKIAVGVAVNKILIV